MGRTTTGNSRSDISEAHDTGYSPTTPGDWTTVPTNIGDALDEARSVTVGGGEANTSSNAGTGGIGIVLPKSGVDLPFKSVKGDVSSGIQVTDDAVNKNVKISVDMAGMAFDATPDGSADTVITFDSSAGFNKRVLLNNLPGGGGGGDTHPIADSTAIVKDPVDATKLLRVDVGGNTTGVTGVLAAAFSTAKTVTLPDATDTLVGKATTDTLTNKTLTTPTIGDFSNAGHNHQNTAGGSTLDHGLALTGLSDDDHTQYALLAGRAGGQTINGGTAGTDNLTLQANAAPSTGQLILNSVTKAKGQIRIETSAISNQFILYESTGASEIDLGNMGSGELRLSTDFSGGAIKLNANTGDFHLSRIGTTKISITSSQVEVKTGNDFKVDTSTLFVDSMNNRVGIGTTTPSKSLHIVTESGPERGPWIEHNGAGAAGPLALMLKSRGTHASPTVVASGDNVFIFQASGYDGSAYQGGGRIVFQVDGTPSAGSVPMRLQFQTGSSGGGTERLRVTSTGNMLYGTTTSPTGTSGKVMIFGDNSGDPNPGTNTAGIYAKNVGTTVEMFAVDEAGNTTQLSPHDPDTGRWIFDSRNVRTGKRMRVDMERAMELLEQLTGERLIERN